MMFKTFDEWIDSLPDNMRFTMADIMAVPRQAWDARQEEIKWWMTKFYEYDDKVDELKDEVKFLLEEIKSLRGKREASEGLV